MIRVGEATSGVSTVLNSFHAATTVTTGFYTNVGEGSVDPPDPPDPPVSSIPRAVGSQSSSPPYIRNQGLVFMSAYGIGPNVPTYIGTFQYKFLTDDYENNNFSVRFANADGANCNYIFPDGPLKSDDKPFGVGFGFFIRVFTTGKAYRHFIGSPVPATGETFFILCGPETMANFTSPYTLRQLVGKPVVFGRLSTLNSLPGTIGFEKNETPVKDTENNLDIDYRELSLGSSIQIGKLQAVSIRVFR